MALAMIAEANDIDGFDTASGISVRAIPLSISPLGPVFLAIRYRKRYKCARNSTYLEAPRIRASTTQK